MENKKLNFININVPSSALVLESKLGVFVKFENDGETVFVWVEKKFASTFNEISSIVNIGIVKDWEYKVYSHTGLLMDSLGEKAYKPYARIKGDKVAYAFMESYPIHNLKKLEWEK